METVLAVVKRVVVATLGATVEPLCAAVGQVNTLYSSFQLNNIKNVFVSDFRRC